MSPEVADGGAWHGILPVPAAGATAMVTKSPGVSADAVIGDLRAIVGGETERLEDRVAAAEARINRFKRDLAELATRHGWPQPRIDQFTGHLEDRLEKALASGQLSSDELIILHRALERL